MHDADDDAAADDQDGFFAAAGFINTPEASDDDEADAECLSRQLQQATANSGTDSLMWDGQSPFYDALHNHQGVPCNKGSRAFAALAFAGMGGT